MKKYLTLLSFVLFTSFSIMNNGFTFSQNDTLTHKEKEEIGLLENIYGIYSIASDIPFYVNQMLSFSGVSSYDSKQLNKITETINSSFLEANFTNQTYNIFITRLEEKHNEEINKILVSNQFQNVTNKELTLVSTSDKQNFTKYLIANFNNPIFINRKQVVSGYIKNTTKSKNITKLVYSIQDLIIKLYDKKDQVQPLRNLSTEMITIIEENYVNELLYKYQNISLSDLQNYFSLFDTEIMKSINLLQIDAFNYALDKVETIVENKIKEIK